MKKVWPWLLAATSGLMMAASFAPLNWGGLCWLSMVPLICAVWFSPEWGKRDWLRIFALGYVSGFFFFAANLFWLSTLTGPGWIALSMYVALYPAVWALFAGTVCKPRQTPGDDRPVWLSSLNNLRVAILGAAAWTALEWLRGVLLTGFGWNQMGVALHANTPMIQISDIVGVGGLSFLVVMTNLIAVITVKRFMLEMGRSRIRPHYDFSVTIALIAISWGYGMREMLAPPQDSIPLAIAAVQGNVQQSTRNDPAYSTEVLDIYKNDTERALAMKPDLVLWPESATPRAIFNDQPTWDSVHALAQEFGGEMLIGTVNMDGNYCYNSMALLTGRGSEAQIYNKMHLVPFGEYLPLRQFALLSWMLGDLIPGDFDFGKQPQVLQMQVKDIKIGPLICFEDTLGELARQSALLGAQIYVTVTNDAWFLKSAGSEQHLDNAIFRCAEMKLPMVRDANTGVTCVVDRFGAVRNELHDEKGGTFIEGVLYAKDVSVPAHPGLTYYAQHGEVFSLGCLALSALAAAFAGVKTLAGKKSACLAARETKPSVA